MAFPSDFTPFAQAFMPTQRWAVRRAEKDQNLAYQQGMAQLEMQKQAQNELLIRQQMELERRMNALPFEGPDIRKRNQFRDEQMKKLAKRIETDYMGDASKFLKAEGQLSVEERWNEFLGSEVFKTGINNARNLALAMQASQKGELLVGSMDADGKYTPGETEMAEFYNGKRDRFNFRSSYKADTGKIYDYFGKQDNPANKYDASATVPQQDIINYIRGNHDPLVAADMIARNYVPSNVPYKRYSLQDALKFDIDMGKDRIDIAYKLQQGQLNQLRGQKLQSEMNGGADGSGRTGMDIAIAGATSEQKSRFVSKPGENYTIGTLDRKLTDYVNSFGELDFMRMGLPADVMQKAVKNLSGVEVGGKVSEMIFADNGGYVLPLSKVPHRVISVNGNIYAPKQELVARSEKKLANGFVKVKIGLSEDAAEDLKLYNDNTILWDTDTEKGRGKYTRNPENSKELIFEGYVPVRGMLSNQMLDMFFTKNAMGQKYATDEFALPP